jgi:c-di-GMP-binding flagellar brake protein YcgR
MNSPTPPHGVQGPGPGDNRRRFPRAQVDLAVRLQFESVQQFMDATAEDLSVGGMFLRSQEVGPDGLLRAVGEVMRLQFDAGGRRMVEGTCRVVRVVPSHEPGQPPGVGIEFVELDETGRRLIEAILAIKLAHGYG